MYTKDLEECAKKLKAFCMLQKDCKKCHFYNHEHNNHRKPYCLINNLPDRWTLPGEKDTTESVENNTR